MNLKERGITIGDLLLIVIFITTTVFIFNKFKGSEKKTSLYMSPYEIQMKKIY